MHQILTFFEPISWQPLQPLPHLNHQLADYEGSFEHPKLKKINPDILIQF